jgi:hypothetical protein
MSQSAEQALLLPLNLSMSQPRQLAERCPQSLKNKFSAEDIPNPDSFSPSYGIAYLYQFGTASYETSKLKFLL